MTSAFVSGSSDNCHILNTIFSLKAHHGEISFQFPGFLFFFLEIFQRGRRSIDRHALHLAINLQIMCLEHALSVMGLY